MKEIEHEGQTYILKADMDHAIKDRIGKVATRASEAESQLRQHQQKLEGLDSMQSQITELQGQLSQSQTKFSRYQAISRAGLSDPDIIDAIEWQYDRSTNGAENKPALDQWLQAQIANPATAPAILRPHLAQLANSTAPTAGPAELASQASSDPTSSQPNPQSYSLPQAPQPPQPPQVNRGAIQAQRPETSIINQGLSDPEFYKANREQIQQQWRQQHKKQR